MKPSERIAKKWQHRSLAAGEYEKLLAEHLAACGVDSMAACAENIFLFVAVPAAAIDQAQRFQKAWTSAYDATRKLEAV